MHLQPRRLASRVCIRAARRRLAAAPPEIRLQGPLIVFVHCHRSYTDIVSPLSMYSVNISSTTGLGDVCYRIFCAITGRNRATFSPS